MSFEPFDASFDLDCWACAAGVAQTANAATTALSTEILENFI
jgi:hypothetical protein